MDLPAERLRDERAWIVSGASGDLEVDDLYPLLLGYGSYVMSTARSASQEDIRHRLAYRSTPWMPWSCQFCDRAYGTGEVPQTIWILAHLQLECHVDVFSYVTRGYGILAAREEARKDDHP